MQQRKLLMSFIVAGGMVCFQPLSAALAQSPDQQPPTQPNRQNPNTPGSPNPNMPGSNDRVSQPGYDRTGQPGTGQPGTTSDMPARSKMDDKTFVKNAAIGGMAEVELGMLAAEKGSTDGVKQFGQKMVDDHSKANDELKEVAKKESIPIPDSLDAKHRARVDSLSKLSGSAFDRAYIKDQLKDHQQDVKEFQNEASSGSMPAVKDFASKTLPTLQEHLSMVKDLDKGKKSTSADRSKQ